MPAIAPIPSTSYRYAFAVGVTLLALALRLALSPLLHATSPFMLFTLAAVISAWYGGFGPGVLSTLAGAALADYFLVKPHGFSHSGDALTRVGLFVVVGTQISWLSGALHRARAKAEREAHLAREGERRYRSLAENFPNGVVFLFTRDLEVGVAGGEALAAATAGRDGVEGRALLDVFAPEARATLEPLYRAALNGERATEEIKQDGRVYLVQTVPVTSEGTAGGAGLAMAVDVTERARARDVLRRARDELEERVEERTVQLQYQKVLLESLIEASLDGILVVSHDHTVVYYNRRFVDLWRIEQPGQADSLDTVTQRMREKLAKSSQDPLIDTKRLRPCPEDGPHAELDLDDDRTLECYSAPVVSADGTGYGRVWFFRDITERKRLEREVLEVCEREQRRIGRDLHDGLGQHLTGISLICKGLERRLAAKAPDEATAASEVTSMIAEAVAHARDLARGLRPVGLAGDGLVQGLGELVRVMSRVSQLPVELRVDRPPEFRDEARTVHLYRIAQEALNNAVRHARPRQVVVSLGRSDGRLRLAVEDDGVGLPERPPRGRGMGLQIMQHRARLIGANMEIRRGDSGGTVVEVFLPTNHLTEQPRR
jgi:signal transduction histidine kinase